MAKILEQKGALVSEKTEKAHVYSPRVSRPEYEKMTLRHLTQNVFRGNPASVVMRLLDESNLNKKEVETIRGMLEKAEKGARR
jgi:predicted transcriptional regulator